MPKSRRETDEKGNPIRVDKIEGRIYYVGRDGYVNSMKAAGRTTPLPESSEKVVRKKRK